MPARKVEEDDLLRSLTRVFQDHGFEGASLTRIRDATGLEKPSLYHRFPRGKEQMAEAVLANAGKTFGEHVLQPLFQPGPPAARVKETGKRIAAFYQNGERSCLLDTLSLPDGGAKVRSAARTAYESWRDAFAKIARESGATPKTAAKRAEQAIIRIEGALVVARVSGDRKPFLEVIHQLPDLLLA